MKRFAIALIAIVPVVLILLQVSRSMSQPPNDGRRRGGIGGSREGGPPPDRLIEALDTNGDGELTGDELSGAPAALMQLDRNRDGQLTENELRPDRGPGRDGFGRGGPGGPGGAGGPGGPGGRGGPGRQRTMLVERFDVDDDGQLSRAERDQARKFVEENNAGGGGRGRVRGGPGRGGPGRGRGGASRGPATSPGPHVEPADVATFADAELYDPSTLRTFFLKFKHEDWEKELAAFYRTDVEVPATLNVDGETYQDVGVRFRGNSSFFTVNEGQKRSFNLTLDFVDGDQNLYGYRTINLLNAHSDPSFLREVLYNRIAREYLPAPRANFVKVVVNGESWGVYINAQQFNKDFTEQWFNERDGVRWKIPAGGGSRRSLTYEGDDRSSYSDYELKSSESEQAWSELIRLCKALDETPTDQLDTKLNRLLNIDRALWFLAVDNVLLDTDGYYSRGSDYLMYQDERFGRFHILPYDSNEVFRQLRQGGGPGGGRRGGSGGQRGGGGLDRPGGRPERGEEQPSNRSPFALSPFAGEDRDDLPLLHRLLANPRIRARYVAHVRTITNKWLDWNVIGPVIHEYRELIDAEVKADTRKLSSYASFVDSLDAVEIGEGRPTPGLKHFVERRREYLINHPDLKKPVPQIQSVTHQNGAGRRRNEVRPADSVRVRASLHGDIAASQVLLYYSTSHEAPFQAVPMYDDGEHGDGQAADRTYAAVVPPQPAGSHVHYYVEARSDKLQTASFYPETSELHALRYRVIAPVADSSPIVINEILASNSKSVKGPDGDFDDWIELHNISDKSVDLSGMYLSDKRDNPRKWSFPAGTTIPANGYLVVWADEDESARGELHANFKLSKSGESVLLVDRDDRGNAILDTFQFEKQKTDVSVGKYPNGSGNPRPMNPSPGKSNRNGA